MSTTLTEAATLPEPTGPPAPTARPEPTSPPEPTTDALLVEVDTGDGWTPVCRYDSLVPGRGVAALVGDHQIALYRDRSGTVHAVGNRDPFSGAHVLSRGLLGSRDGTPVVLSPMYKQAFDLRTGVCLDEEEAPDGSPAALPVWPVRTHAVSSRAS
ncbi:nitrite reductase small subunit NirD [Streptomyces sp. NPDC051561]|uniref:nitrite reductase small subunit NirD n=1 Tax=Streptomyces sp. NPDC051561 TaxID=3365658 RepID=UPI0037908652